MIDKSEKSFEIILEYIKDLSIETPSASTLLFVRENISNYNLDIDISSLLLKSKALEITTKLILQDKNENIKSKAFFEIKYAVVISIEDAITDKKIIGKIVLCDLQKEIYPKIENIFLELIRNAGYPDLKFDKKIDFEKMYNDKFS